MPTSHSRNAGGGASHRCNSDWPELRAVTTVSVATCEGLGCRGAVGNSTQSEPCPYHRSPVSTLPLPQDASCAYHRLQVRALPLPLVASRTLPVPPKASLYPAPSPDRPGVPACALTTRGAHQLALVHRQFRTCSRWSMPTRDAFTDGRERRPRPSEPEPPPTPAAPNTACVSSAAGDGTPGLSEPPWGGGGVGRGGGGGAGGGALEASAHLSSGSPMALLRARARLRAGDSDRRKQDHDLRHPLPGCGTGTSKLTPG